MPVIPFFHQALQLSFGLLVLRVRVGGDRKGWKGLQLSFELPVLRERDARDRKLLYKAQLPMLGPRVPTLGDRQHTKYYAISNVLTRWKQKRMSISVYNITFSFTPFQVRRSSCSCSQKAVEES